MTTTIRDEIKGQFGVEADRAVALMQVRALGVDPDLPAGSIVVTERPKCPTCEGEGWGPWKVGDGYGRKERSECPTCKGTGYVPAEWATVDRCLTWLRERGIDGQAAGWTDGFAVHLVGSERPISAATLHAALIAACKAV